VAAALCPGLPWRDTVPDHLAGYSRLPARECVRDALRPVRATATDSAAVLNGIALHGHECGRPDAPPVVDGVSATAGLGRSRELWQMVEPVAARIYGKAADTACIAEGATRIKRVLYWRSRSGMTSVIFPSDSAREVNYRDPGVLSISLAPLSLTGTLHDCSLRQAP
jgi:hypothetical protein